MKVDEADSRNEFPVIRYIEDVLQVKLLPYQKLLVIHAFETNEFIEAERSEECSGMKNTASALTSSARTE